MRVRDLVTVCRVLGFYSLKNEWKYKKEEWINYEYPRGYHAVANERESGVSNGRKKKVNYRSPARVTRAQVRRKRRIVVRNGN